MLPTRPRRESAKRARTAPQEEREGDSSATSSADISVDSASRSTPSGDANRVKGTNSQSSVESEEEDSESSEESESDSDDNREEGSEMDMAGDGVETVRAQTKPNIRPGFASGAGSLAERLQSFLPKMKEANDGLGEGDTIEDVGDEEPHIEMNLGLGVLKEKREGEEDSSDDSEEESEDEGGAAKKDSAKQEKDAMGKLMGGREKHGGGIEEVG